MPSKKKVIKIYVTPEEYGEIQTSAMKSGLSLSTFAKKVCLGSPVYSRVEARAVLALMKSNADLARLGNLIKAAMNLSYASPGRIEKLLIELENARQDIRDKIQELKK